MSMYSGTTHAADDDRPVARGARDAAGDRLRRWLSLLLAVVVLVWSAAELVNLGLNHTTGPEIYGVLVATLAVVAGLVGGFLLWSGDRRAWLTVATLCLWTLVALGGIGGAIAHIVGPVAGHGPVDLRERPTVAPLIFTALGLVGGAAVVYGQRVGTWFSKWNGGR
jgi:hypothetical protein